MHRKQQYGNLSQYVQCAREKPGQKLSRQLSYYHNKEEPIEQTKWENVEGDT